MRRFIRLALAGVALVTAAGWVLTSPAEIADDFAQSHTPDVENGQLVFTAGGCASCHVAPKKAEAETDPSPPSLVLAGGKAFASDFGTFYAPNISPDSEAGIGGWTFENFARAVTKGVSPGGQHYYPAFPYTAYTHMRPEDVRDLFTYIQTLPASSTPSQAHEVGFPFNIRRAVGVWKLLHLRDDYVLGGDQSPEVTRGRYLAEALGHCGECHTARSALGGLQRDAWLAGAPNPSGKGRIPNITPEKLDWSEIDLVAYFETGFTPDYDSVGGEMVEVVSNLAQLPAEDREALAVYLKAVPPHP